MPKKFVKTRKIIWPGPFLRILNRRKLPDKIRHCKATKVTIKRIKFANKELYLKKNALDDDWIIWMNIIYNHRLRFSWSWVLFKGSKLTFPFLQPPPFIAPSGDVTIDNEGSLASFSSISFSLCNSGWEFKVSGTDTKVWKIRKAAD